MKSWALEIDQDGVVLLPADLLAAAGWSVGDCLQYIDNLDGTYTVVKEDLTTFVNSGIINNEQN